MALIGVRRALAVGTGEGGNPLAAWLSGGVSGKKIVAVGDSRRGNAVTLFNALNNFHTQPGMQLAGVTVVNRGVNGATIDAWRTAMFATAVADNADLYEISLGTNDFRIGVTSATYLPKLLQLGDDLKSAVPKATILLTVPYIFLSTDVGGNGYVVPNSSAQAYSTDMRLVYALAHAQRPRWAYEDTAPIFGTTCLASSPLMADQLHANDAGQYPQALQIADTLSGRAAFSQSLSNAAHASNPTAPWTVYSRAIEDPTRYSLIVGGDVAQNAVKSGAVSATANAGYIDFQCDDYTAVHQLDYVEQAWGGATWQIPSGASIVNQGSGTVRIFGLGGSLPAISQAGGQINIFRKM